MIGTNHHWNKSDLGIIFGDLYIAQTYYLMWQLFESERSSERRDVAKKCLTFFNRLILKGVVGFAHFGVLPFPSSRSSSFDPNQIIWNHTHLLSPSYPTTSRGLHHTKDDRHLKTGVLQRKSNYPFNLPIVINLLLTSSFKPCLDQHQPTNTPTMASVDQLASKYGAQLKQLKSIFPSWDEGDLALVVQDAKGSVDEAAMAITEGEFLGSLSYGVSFDLAFL